MNKILKLAKKYYKQSHLSLLPFRDSNKILDNLNFLYDEKWENQNSYPYEILTYLLDCYYVLPERPDLASLFCWQAINHSYYEQQLGDSNLSNCTDKQGVQLVRKIILDEWNKRYKAVLEPYLLKLHIKIFHYVASYLLKGYAMESGNIIKKYWPSAYSTLIREIPMLKDILINSYGNDYNQIANPVVVENKVNLGIDTLNKEKSRTMTHSFAMELSRLVKGEKIEITCSDAARTKNKYCFTEKDRLSFVLFGVLYASRCNNFHGNVAARMNSVNSDKQTFEMYTDIFLTEYIILAIHMHSQGNLSDVALDKVKENVSLMI